MEIVPKRLLLLIVVCLQFLTMVGCATQRTITIRTMPADANIWIDGAQRAERGQVTEQFTFKAQTDTHRVTASRLGFKDAFETITRDPPRNEILLQLKPETRPINIIVQPAPAIVRIDGVKVSDTPISSITIPEQVMGVDVKNNPLIHVITAERDHFVTVRLEFSRTDANNSYTLKLDWMKKNLTVTTNPPGAKIFMGEEPLGVSPVQDVPVEFPVDLDLNEFLTQKLRAEKAGYEPAEIGISWDSGKTDYHLDLGVRHKDVRIFPDPPDSTVTIDGAEASHGANGVISRTLQFPPVNEAGDLKTYTIVVSHKVGNREWEPQTLTIGWENRKIDYPVKLKEILTCPVPMLSIGTHRTDSGWQMQPEHEDMVAMRDPSEGPNRPAPELIIQLARGSQLGSFTLSPDGQRIVYTILSSSGPNDLKSQMWVIPSDHGGVAESLLDGKSLDIMPSFSPDDSQILFSSNRGGRRMNIWSMPASGAAMGISRLTGGDTHDLWPVVDSDPRPRLFYQALIDTRPDPRIYMTQLNTVFQTDLAANGGMQPRVSPKNDAIVFTARNEQTGKRAIYRMSDRGGVAQSLTNDPEADEFDPSFSRDGSRIIFASDRAADDKGQHHCDIWMIDLSKPEQPIRITTNASHDDCPAFDVTGTAVYFRSNRAGQWGIWKMPIR